MSRQGHAASYADDNVVHWKFYNPDGSLNRDWSYPDPYTVSDLFRYSGEQGRLTTLPGTNKKVRLPTSMWVEERTNNAFSGSVTYNGDDGSSWEMSGANGAFVNHGGDGRLVLGSSFGSDDNAKSQALTECLNKIGGKQTDVLTNLATLRQSHSMIASNAVAIASALRAVRHGNIALAAKNLSGRRTMGGLYLEWQYGWKPLADDLVGAFNLFKGDASSVDGRVKETRRITKQISHTQDTPHMGYKWSCEGKAIYTCHLEGIIQNNYLHAANTWGLTNPFFTAWDLVPYSFVLDWFMPVGNFLEACSAPIGLDFWAGYESHLIEFTNRVEQVFSDPKIEVNSPFGGETKGRHYARHALGAWPMPEIYTKSPFSETHAWEALALLAQLRR